MMIVGGPASLGWVEMFDELQETVAADIKQIKKVPTMRGQRLGLWPARRAFWFR